ncbi:hypothetical protein [Paenibacillus sp. GM2FR]|nr:hypothetical protein [Paenibacillus sp. GM2FR]
MLKSFHNFLIWIKSNLQVKKVLVVALMNAWGLLEKKAVVEQEDAPIL